MEVDTVSIIAWIVLGAIAGYLAGFIVKGDEGLGIIGHIVPNRRMSRRFRRRPPFNSDPTTARDTA
jgi:hypothetical protein